ncbi:hypothetical protein PVAP13_1NG540600 [Panicum virgatum]|uniref:Uncharacterized protein n=1 Tax=Panicum virgatum TaxID=38727 RepID=A0A8T0X5X4_PANVG|nr:hypothetical protein PVAP13_1NG540600 [Panicum virgatum]
MDLLASWTFQLQARNSTSANEVTLRSPIPKLGKTKEAMSSPHSTLVTKNSAMETRRPGTDSRRLGTR